MEEAEGVGGGGQGGAEKGVPLTRESAPRVWTAGWVASRPSRPGRTAWASASLRPSPPPLPFPPPPVTDPRFGGGGDVAGAGGERTVSGGAGAGSREGERGAPSEPPWWQKDQPHVGAGRGRTQPSGGWV